ncbi:trypsin-like peptidase domain-containing protein [Candidatus Poribacteria bacterium]|nr:trypsin-like peptidase domain-containing protein [Candidatus Poribacteria bacterium]
MRKLLFLLLICNISFLFITSQLIAQQNLQNTLPDFVEKRLGKGWIQDIEFSPNNENFAVATTIGIWIYNSMTGIEVNSFEGVMGGANAISYSPDGRFIAAAHQDNTIRIWDTTKNQEVEIPTLRGHNKTIYDLIYSPDGTKLASAGADNNIRLWNLKNLSTHQRDTMKSKLLPYRDTVLTVAFSFDNQLVAGGSVDGTIQVWDANTGDQIYIFTEHTKPVEEVVFSPDRKELASASTDQTVRVWSLVGVGGQLDETILHDSPVYTVSYLSNGNSIVTGSADKLIHIWNTETYKEQQNPLTGHKDHVSVLDCSTDSTIIVSGSPDGTVLVWDVIGERMKFAISGHTGGIKALVYTEDNRIRASGTGLDGKLRIWDAGTSSELSTIRDHFDLTQSVMFSNDGKQVASGGSYDGTVFLSEVEKILSNNNSIQMTTVSQRFNGNPHGISALAISPRNSVIATGGADGNIYIFNIQAERLLKKLTGAQHPITSLTFSSDGRILFSGEENGTLRKWDALTGREIGTGIDLGPIGTITALGFRNEDSMLLIGNKKGQILLTQFKQKFESKGQVSLLPYPSEITSIIFSKDETSVIVGCENGSIFICDYRNIKQNINIPKNLTTNEKVRYINNYKQESNKPTLSVQEIASKARVSSVYIQTYDSKGDSSGIGSGFFIAPGKIATNYHVIDKASSIYVSHVGEEKWIKVIRAPILDKSHDLAILIINRINTPTLPLANSDNIEIGESIYAVGNPQGWEGTFSQGIVSSIRGIEPNKWIQITAPVSPGSSGGAILNSNSEVIGVATLAYFTIDPKVKVNRTQNINFAVPSNYLKDLLKKVR